MAHGVIEGECEGRTGHRKGHIRRERQTGERDIKLETVAEGETLKNIVVNRRVAGHRSEGREQHSDHVAAIRLDSYGRSITKEIRNVRLCSSLIAMGQKNRERGDENGPRVYSEPERHLFCAPFYERGLLF